MDSVETLETLAKIAFVTKISIDEVKTKVELIYSTRGHWTYEMVTMDLYDYAHEKLNENKNENQ